MATEPSILSAVAGIVLFFLILWIGTICCAYLDNWEDW